MSIKNKFFASSIIMLVLPIVVMMLISALFLMFIIGFLPNISININEVTPLFDNVYMRNIIVAWLIVFIVVVIGCCIGVTAYLSRSIITPIKKISIAMNHISSGDLDYEFTCSEDLEVKELYDSMERLRLRLKESVNDGIVRDRENKILLSNISHDLKTPITSIKGYVEGIKDGVADTPEKMDAYLDTILLKSDTLSSMVQNLSMYTKLETNNVPYDFEKVNLYDYVVNALGEYEIDLKNSDVELEIFSELSDKENVYTNIDDYKMKRVFSNIIENAIKYRRPDVSGKLLVGIRNAKEGAMLTFSDNGIGIKQEDEKRIFEMFYRSDPARNTDQSGNGLGLAIAKKIVIAHGGRIWVRANSEKPGVTVHVYLKTEN